MFTDEDLLGAGIIFRSITILMLPDEQTAVSQQYPTVEAMLPQSGSNIDLASKMSEKSPLNGPTHNGSTLGEDSKVTSPSSSSHGGDVENQKSSSTAASNDDSFAPEWRKTKRKVCKENDLYRRINVRLW